MMPHFFFNLIRSLPAMVPGLLVSVLTAGTVGASTTTTGAGTSPWFVEATAGLSIIPGGDIVLNGTAYEADYDNGTLLMLGLGRRWTEQWSTELEWMYRSNSVDQLVAPGSVLTAGDLASNSIFLNVTYALPADWRVWGIGAYAGLGLGWMQETDYDLAAAGEFSTRGEVAFQWSVGLDRKVGSAGRLFIAGRAIGGGEQELDRSTGAGSLTVDYDAWSLLLGLSWAF